MLLVIYSSFAISLKGQTAGKWLLNLKVVNNKNYERLSVTKSILRESLLKLFSAMLFFTGFIWIAVSKQKFGLHDKIVNSKVVRSHGSSIKEKVVRLIGICSLTLFLGGYIWKVLNPIFIGEMMKLPKTFLNLPFIERDPDDVNSISKITSYSTLFSWLDNNACRADEYAILTASGHKLTLFGETHGVKDNLDFFGQIIPDLYHKAGIRCIGMECIPKTMNHEICKLINGKTYDNELTLKIARSQPWRLWGMNEYWDILETVWRLNQNLPDSCIKMRIVGIDEDWDGPDIALVLPTNSDDGLKNVPVWEKLKLFTSIDDLVRMAYRDELMARNVEKEIIEKGDKGVVLIGSAHTPLQYGYPIIYGNKVRFIKGRFGLILNQKYKSDLGQILLWHSISKKAGQKPDITSFLESVLSEHGNVPVGFIILNSPFGKLRDSTAAYFNTYKTICLEDIYQGLIFLKPLDKLLPCRWKEDYISREMFLKYRLFYELKTKQKFQNYKECNEFFAKASQEEKFLEN